MGAIPGGVCIAREPGAILGSGILAVKITRSAQRRPIDRLGPHRRPARYISGPVGFFARGSYLAERSPARWTRVSRVEDRLAVPPTVAHAEVTFVEVATAPPAYGHPHTYRLRLVRVSCGRLGYLCSPVFSAFLQGGFPAKVSPHSAPNSVLRRIP